MTTGIKKSDSQTDAEIAILNKKLKIAELRIKDLEGKNQALLIKLEKVHSDKPRSPMCG